jgi:RNA recognition motif-containing protein
MDSHPTNPYATQMERQRVSSHPPHSMESNPRANISHTSSQISSSVVPQHEDLHAFPQMLPLPHPFRHIAPPSQMTTVGPSNTLDSSVPTMSSCVSRNDGCKQLIVNYLAPSVTSAELHSLFAAFGVLDGARVIYDRDSGNTRGYGFVYYREAASAAAAIAAMNGFELHGKWLKVAYSNNPLHLAAMKRRGGGSRKAQRATHHRSTHGNDKGSSGSSGEMMESTSDHDRPPFEDQTFSIPTEHRDER